MPLVPCNKSDDECSSTSSVNCASDITPKEQEKVAGSTTNTRGDTYHQEEPLDTSTLEALGKDGVGDDGNAEGEELEGVGVDEATEKEARITAKEDVKVASDAVDQILL